MWPEEVQDKYCHEYSSYTDVKDQKDCQQRCLAKSKCVGISYSYKYKEYCYLCDSDKLSYDEFDHYGFYRRPGMEIKHNGSSILEFWLFCCYRSFSVNAYKMSLLLFIDKEDIPLIVETEPSLMDTNNRIGNI